MNPTSATKALGEVLAAKHAQAVANGATDEQAIKAVRLIWLDAMAARS